LTDSADLIRRYLIDVIAAEKTFEQHLRSIAAEGDDAEVQLAFIQHAEETRSQYDRLKSRLEAIGGEASEAKHDFASLLDLAPRIAQAGGPAEEHLIQNLITAFSLETGECAMYEALAHVARASGDEVTEQLAREIQAEEQRTAEKLFHFLPTRSKIAFNVLTPHEIDPAVETKAGFA
jgi:ferritin-like metal-binding protein YciE